MRFILCFHSIVRRLISSGRLNRCVHINKSMHEYLLMRAREREKISIVRTNLFLSLFSSFFFSLLSKIDTLIFHSIPYSTAIARVILPGAQTVEKERGRREVLSLSLSFPAVFSSPSSSCWQFFHTALTVTARVHGSARSFLLFVCVCFSLLLSLSPYSIDILIAPHFYPYFQLRQSVTVLCL